MLTMIGHKVPEFGSQAVNTESNKNQSICEDAKEIQFTSENWGDHQINERYLENYLLQNFDIQPKRNSTLPPMVKGSTKNFIDFYDHFNNSETDSRKTDSLKNENLVTYLIHLFTMQCC